MLDHRLQILLDRERYAKISHLAELRGLSIAALIREAIDRLPADEARRRVAIAAFLEAPSMDVPLDPADLRREINEAHQGRAE